MGGRLEDTSKQDIRAVFRERRLMGNGGRGGLGGAQRDQPAGERGAEGVGGHLRVASDDGGMRAATSEASCACGSAPWVANPPWVLLMLSTAGDGRSAWRWRDEDDGTAASDAKGGRPTVDGDAWGVADVQSESHERSDAFVFSAVQDRSEARNSRPARRYKRPGHVSKPTVSSGAAELTGETGGRAEKEAKLRSAAVAHAKLAAEMTGGESSTRAAMRVGRVMAGDLHIDVVFATLRAGARRVRAARVVQAAYRWHRGRALKSRRSDGTWYCTEPGSVEMYEINSLATDWRLQRLVHGVGSARDMHEVLCQQGMGREQWLATKPPSIAYWNAMQGALRAGRRTALAERMQAGDRAAVAEAVRFARWHTTQRVCWERYLRQLWHDLRELVATGERGRRSALVIQVRFRSWRARRAQRAKQRVPEATPSPQQTRSSDSSSHVEASTPAARRFLLPIAPFRLWTS